MSKDKKFTAAQIAKQLAKELTSRVTKGSMSGKAAKALKDRKKTITRGVRIAGAKHRND